MPRDQLSIRVDAGNPLHHLWRNHGTWWIHYTLNSWDGRTRRVRLSLGTRDAAIAIAHRDALLARSAREDDVALPRLPQTAGVGDAGGARS